MVRDEVQFTRSRLTLAHDPTFEDNITIDFKDFELRARQLEVHDLTEFYNSGLFQNSFHVDQALRKIVKKA